MRVWLDSWEWQCCGERFAVGSVVDWALTPISAEATSFLAKPLGADVVDGISHYEGHHPDEDEPARTLTRGRVESIKAVYWGLDRRPGEAPVYDPRPLSAVYESRDSADGSDPDEREGGLRFSGYIVELSPTP